MATESARSAPLRTRPSTGTFTVYTTDQARIRGGASGNPCTRSHRRRARGLHHRAVGRGSRARRPDGGGTRCGISPHWPIHLRGSSRLKRARLPLGDPCRTPRPGRPVRFASPDERSHLRREAGRAPAHGVPETTRRDGRASGGSARVCSRPALVILVLPVTPTLGTPPRISRPVGEGGWPGDPRSLRLRPGALS